MVYFLWKGKKIREVILKKNLRRILEQKSEETNWLEKKSVNNSIKKIRNNFEKKKSTNSKESPWRIFENKSTKEYSKTSRIFKQKSAKLRGAKLWEIMHQENPPKISVRKPTKIFEINSRRIFKRKYLSRNKTKVLKLSLL